MKQIPNFAKEVALFKSKHPAFKGQIQQSSLRAEVELIDANGVYTFDFRAAKNSTKIATEILLNDNDMFRALEFDFALASKLLSNPSIRVPQTYPNPIIFDSELDDSPAGTFDTNHLEAVYNGWISYKKGDTVYAKAIFLDGARWVPQTQQTSLTNKSSSEQETSGIVKLERPITLIGTDIGDLVLNIPGASTLRLQYSTVANVTTVPKKVIAILQLNGMLISGGNKLVTSASAEMDA